MIVERDKTYITAGGYVVKLNHNLSAPGMSPGQNDDYCVAGPGGWCWEKDGRILGLLPEWMEKLKIVSECSQELPVLPEGYRWVDGFPQVRIPKRGEYFLSYDSRTKKFGDVKYCDRDYVTPYGTDGRRLILEKTKDAVRYYKNSSSFSEGVLFVKRNGNKLTQVLTNGDIGESAGIWGENHELFIKQKSWIEVSKEEVDKKIKEYTVKYYKHREKFGGGITFIKKVNDRYGCARGNSNPNMDQLWDRYCKTLVNDGTWVEISEGDALKLLNVNSVTSVPDVLSFKKEEGNTVKKETALKVVGAVARFAGNWGFRALNYWVFEPAAGFGKPIVKSVRYATFLTMVGGSIYGYYHPQEVKNAIKSCLPKITIEAPEIMRG